MVRALLAGRKTQTRRVVKPRKDPDYGCHLGPGEIAGDEHLARPRPFGQPGDRLWVREAWRVGAKYNTMPPRELPPQSMTVLYEAGGSAARGSDGWRLDTEWPTGDLPQWAGKLRPGMFMPRWASRITLEVTEVRVERRQDIGEADAVAEGVAAHPDGPRHAYRSLWTLINGHGSWEANPWVWVVGFKQVEADRA